MRTANTSMVSERVDAMVRSIVSAEDDTQYSDSEWQMLRKSLRVQRMFIGCQVQFNRLDEEVIEYVNLN